jgi:hypothetical protein
MSLLNISAWEEERSAGVRASVGGEGVRRSGGGGAPHQSSYPLPQDPGVVTPIFFGYDVQRIPQPPEQQRLQFQPQQQPQPQPQHHRQRLPASMGFSAGPMRHIMRDDDGADDLMEMMNGGGSFYQSFQAKTKLDGMDRGLYNNYDGTHDVPHPQERRAAMYMTDQHGNESIVGAPVNSAYRLQKS